MRVIFQIKCRLPWFKYAKREIELRGNTFEEINQECLQYEKEFCPDIVFNKGKDRFRANNLGEVQIDYSEGLECKQIISHINILISFISMCVGDICQCEDWIIIDNKKEVGFFNFPLETLNGLSLCQKNKFWEVCFEELRNDFGSILDFLFFSSESKTITTHILPNYLATNYIIDFLGNKEWKFKNAVTTIESLMNYIKKKEYESIEKDNNSNYKMLKLKVKELKEIDGVLRCINSYSCPKRISLATKLQDAILLGEKYLGVDIQKNINLKLYANKCANTRNVLSHYIEENTQNSYLKEDEISDATYFFITLTRYLLLNDICKNVDITKNFKNNLLMRKYLNIYTNWN